MQLISEGRIDTTHLITHRYPLSRIQEAYDLFANHTDNVIKTAIYPD
jgi:alcohol dehydrogenase